MGEPAIRLVGDEYQEDRAFLEELLAISRNLVALLDPGSLRLAAVESLDGPPPGLPAAYASRTDERGRERPGPYAPELRWLRLKTPDFSLVPSGFLSSVPPGTPRLYRVSLGLDPRAGRPLLALVEEEVLGRVDPITALCVSLEGYRPISDYAAPSLLSVYRVDAGTPGRPFEEQPSWTLAVLAGSTLRPALDPATFLSTAEPDQGFRGGRR